MCEPLPEWIDAERLAEEHTRLVGTVPLDKMPRLANVALARDGMVWADLDFALQPEGHAVVTGNASAKVPLTCQRCLERVDWSLETQLALAIIHDEEKAATLPADYDPLLWSGRTGSLAALIEDELLLALPVVARHDDPADCGSVAGLASAQSGDEVREDNRKYPFAELESLLKNRR